MQKYLRPLIARIYTKDETKAGFHAEARRRGEKPDLTANGREFTRMKQKADFHTEGTGHTENTGSP